MDKSYDFKRKSLYWHSVIKNDSDYLSQCYSDHSTIDRYSHVSSLLFNRLICFESLLSPYSLSNDVQTHNNPFYGNIQIPNNHCLNTFIGSKRNLFNKIGIESIVHDTKLIGEMINQLEETLLNDTNTSSKSESLLKHKQGINSCLNYLFQIVKDYVQNYQRLKLKFESSVTNTVKIMTENMSELRNIDSSQNFDSIPNSYLSHFFNQQDQSHSDFKTSDSQDSNHSSEKSGYASSDENLLNSTVVTSVKTTLGSASNNSNTLLQNAKTSSNYGSLKYERGVYNISSNYIEPFELDDQQVADTLIQQHARTVNSINDQIKANELIAINSVQERLSEISSMFVKLTGTVEQQNELHQIINANVQESISNIEKTQDTLKKTSKESLPLYHRIFCTALVGMSIFLLVIDYLKSSKGSYFF